MLRTILALALASSAWADTICSLEPAACDGSYLGTTLDLVYGKGLTGGVPTQLGLLTDLKRLFLNSNDLSGSVPSQFGLLTALEYMYLYDNDLSGSLPSQLGLLTDLGYLWLYDNDLSGSLPSQLGKLDPAMCNMGGTNSYDCPLPALADNCLGTEGQTSYEYGTDGPWLECVATPTPLPSPPSSPPSAYCKNLKRLKRLQKYKNKQEKWEKKCSA